MTWSHYRELLAVNNPQERQALAQKTEKEGWGRDRLREEIQKQKPAAEEAPPGKKLTAAPGKAGVYRVVRALEGPHKGNLVVDLGFSNYFQLGNMGEFTAGDLIFVEPVKQSSKGLATRFHFKRVFSARSQEKLHVSLGVEYIVGDETLLFTYPAYAVRVIDGDTFDAVVDLGFGFTTIQKLRLRGLDAPELPTQEGLDAKGFLEKYLKPFSKIVIKTSKSDKYDRYLVDIWAGDTYVNQKLLDEGYAVEMNG